VRKRHVASPQLVAGALLIGGAILVVVGAALPDARVFTSPDQRVRWEAIAARQWGWTAQAVMFPTAFAVVAAGLVAATRMGGLRGHPARRLTEASAVLGVAAAALWVPISIERLNEGAMVNALLARQATDASTATSPTFWPYTVCAVAASGSLAAALAWSGILRRLGAAITVVAGGAFVAMALLRDWPPFATYVIMLPLGVGLVAQRPRHAQHAGTQTHHPSAAGSF
jgi:hypothetical protein